MPLLCGSDLNDWVDVGTKEARMAARSTSEHDVRPSDLGHAILQLLSRSPASGYDLKTRFQASLGHGWHAYDTQIYRELKRLEDAGYTTGEVVKGRSGPDRRLYAVTPKGKEALREWLPSPIDFAKNKDEFALRMWTLDLFPEGTAEPFLMSAREEWIAALEHQRLSLRVLRETHGEPDGSSPDAVFGRQLGIELGIAVNEAKLAWVERALKVLEARSHRPR
jgi:DNA-binding PadR family transcriptional regulator